MLDDDGYFGESVAAGYDESAAGMFASDVVGPVVDLLAELAGGGRALELGIGTGRIALPLAERGVEVHGIEMSRAMVERMRAKPGGDAIGVTIGDFSTAKVEVEGEADGGFSLAYLVFNTIMNLTSQDAQVDCFRNVAEHLEPGGHFVVEVGIPDLRRLPPGQNAVPFRVGDGRVGFDLYDDLATQSMSSHHVRVDEDGRGSYLAVPFRYVWPSELDLMARLAGMRLRERWDGWSREPFTGESKQHVSVWEKVAG
ncbi:class I SAM-dependent methyltransferase [Streptomyces sp. NPDC047081]|uniref:class I SAM-dependent methyltransferase n=1 Tax=Streptomyces sp. NPDC047081 TaxID=3154706 RepID=UPI0033FC1166